MRRLRWEKGRNENESGQWKKVDVWTFRYRSRLAFLKITIFETNGNKCGLRRLCRQ